MKIWDDLFKATDGTWDLSRILLAVGAVSFIIQSGVNVYRDHTLDLQAFGIGFAAIAGGGGLGVKWHNEAS